MATASLLISVAAIAISLLALWKTHFAPFSALAVAGRLTLRVYPIKSGTERWFIPSLNVPISITNEGARPGVISGLRLKLHFPGIPIPGNCEFLKPRFEIAHENAKDISKNRFEWIDRIVVAEWMPFTVLPKTTVTKHWVFESRWEDPVVQKAVNCTLEVRSDSNEWCEVASWHVDLSAIIWSELVDVGSGLTFHPKVTESVQPPCTPSDLHKYTGTKDQIPKGGFSAVHDSSLDYPADDQGA